MLAFLIDLHTHTQKHIHNLYFQKQCVVLAYRATHGAESHCDVIADISGKKAVDMPSMHLM